MASQLRADSLSKLRCLVEVCSNLTKNDQRGRPTFDAPLSALPRLPGRRNLLLCSILRRVSDLLDPGQESLVEPGQESLVEPGQKSLVEPGQESLLTLFHSVGVITSTPSPTRAFFMSVMALTTETRKISSRDRRRSKCGTTETKKLGK